MPAQQEQAQQRDGSGQSFLRSALQSVGIFLLVQFALKQFTGAGGGGSTTGAAVNGTNPAAAKVDIPPFHERPELRNLEGPYNPIPQRIAPIWPENATIDLTIYVSPSLVMPSLKAIPETSKVAHETNIRLDDFDDVREISAIFPVPPQVQRNGTLFAHFYISRTGASADPTEDHYNPAEAYHFVRPLNQYFVKRKHVKKRNLLSESASDVAEEVEEPQDQKRVIASYYHPNYTLSFVPKAGVQTFPSMHPAAREWVQLESTGARDITGQNGWYYPMLWLNTFWQLRNHMTEINSTVTELPINFHLDRSAYWKFSTVASLDFGARQNAIKVNQGELLPGGGDGSELEDVKRILLDSNIYLLSTTVIVGILHTILEMLAFKSDVSHWRNKKDNVGVSVRTILANVVMKLIIFLYLLDQSEHTSWMILLGEAMGIALEAWKVTTAVNVRFRATSPGSFIPYTVVFEDKHKLSETEKKTQEYDEIAFRYMYMVAVPLIIAYAGYSLYYESHKSWYSFVIATLVGSVYAYGFLMMVPSLYINYRLKSVAHMPGKAMAYKFVNTFIDDLFAFTVKMPILHRLATFRDDIVFFVYLYQTWAYKVDHTRVNEFGQGGDDEDVKEKLAAKPLTSPAEGQTSAIKEVAEESSTTGADKGAAKKRK